MSDTQPCLALPASEPGSEAPGRLAQAPLAKAPLAKAPLAKASRSVLVAVLFLAAYCLLDRIALLLPADAGGVTPWNLSAGIILAMFILVGPRFAPVVFAAELASTLLTPAPALPFTGAMASALAVTVAYGVAGSILRGHIDPRLRRQRDLVLLLAAALGAAIVAAGLNALVMVAWSDASWSRAPDMLFRGCTADFLGECLMAPALMTLRLRRPRVEFGAWIEYALQALTLLGFIALVFAAGDPANRVRVYYTLFLPQIWIATRGGVRGVVLSNLAVQAGVLVSLVSRPDGGGQIFEFQFRLLALALSGLFLAVAVTERRTVEAALAERQEELARVSRLSAAGEMAAVLAHELTQPLTAVVAFARAARRLASPESAANPKFTAAIEGAVSQSERAGGVIHALRQFIARGEPERGPQNPAELIADAASLMSTESRRARARIVIATDRDLPPVQADRVQIQQVLVNLLQNGLNAVSRGPATVRQVTLSASADADGGVEFEVADTGPGVPAEVAARLFSPFPGGADGGLGLGLVICRGVVEAHRGRIWLAENRPGVCAVRFTLPAAGRATGGRAS